MAARASSRADFFMVNSLPIPNVGAGRGATAVVLVRFFGILRCSGLRPMP